MSNLTFHAQQELTAAGIFDKDADYGGALGTAVMELIETFDKQGHSGMSAAMTLALFDKVARFENITPLTSNPDEWMNVSEISGSGTGLWQNRRRSTTFSRDGGQTWYDIDDESLNNGDTWRT